MEGRAKSFRVPALDGIRAYAIGVVVLMHVLGAAGVLAESEGTNFGVWLWAIFGNTIDAFFVISAFVLFLPTVRRGGEFGSARRFWTLRAARLLPAFWLVIVLTLILAALVPPGDDWAYPSLAEIVAHLTLLQMPANLLDSGFRLGFGIDGPVWLISIVVAFYALLPAIARPWYRHPIAALGLAAALTVGWKELIGKAPGLIGSLVGESDGFVRIAGVDQFPGWAFSFALGMTGAWAFVRLRERYEPERLSRTALLVLPAVLAVYVFASYLRGRHALDVPGNVAQFARTHPLATLIDSASRAALMGIVVIGPAWMSRPFVNRPTARLAELSYGVYLVHFVLIVYAIELLAPPQSGTFADFLLWSAIVIPASLLFAWLSRRFVELPVLDRVRSRMSAGEGARPSSAPRPTTLQDADRPRPG